MRERWNRDVQAHDEERERQTVWRRRAPLPPGTVSFGIDPIKRNAIIQTDRETTLQLRYNLNTELGTVSYYLGNVGAIHEAQRPTVEEAPYLYQTTDPGRRALPRILVITDFHSRAERQVRGVGSALLRELLRVADIGDCAFVAVASGVNYEVYSALGFDMVKPTADTWCAPVARLRARLSPLHQHIGAI